MIHAKKIIQLKEIAKNFLMEFDNFLLENDIQSEGIDIIDEVRLDGKINFVSLIDMVINEDYYYNEDYSNIMNELQNISSKYGNKYSDIRVRIVAFSNSPTTLSEVESVQDVLECDNDVEVNEGFFKNKSFFHDMFSKIADKDEIEVAKQIKKDHPEVFKKFDDATDEYTSYLIAYRKKMGLDNNDTE